MKIQNIKNIEKFFETVNKCEGRVELVSVEGDRLNLKSELTKYVALANIFGNKKLTKELELMVSNPEDVKLLLNFMVNQ